MQSQLLCQKCYPVSRGLMCTQSTFEMLLFEGRFPIALLTGPFCSNSGAAPNQAWCCQNLDLGRCESLRSESECTECLENFIGIAGDEGWSVMSKPLKMDPSLTPCYGNQVWLRKGLVTTFSWCLMMQEGLNIAAKIYWTLRSQWPKIPSPQCFSLVAH